MSKRITKEFAELQANPPEDMKVDLASESDFHKWIVTINGPKESPYATKIYHPNVTNDGKGSMCLGILRDGEWKPSSRMHAALEYVRQLMVEPVTQDPVEPAIADEYNNNKKQFIKTAKQWTKTYA
ncbi:MAG: hypothetical protein Q9182_001040 [Xanthomendoza sp. 2 TL-2023]